MEPKLDAVLEQLLTSDSPVKRAMGRLAATGFQGILFDWLAAERARGSDAGDTLIAMTKLLGGILGLVLKQMNSEPPPLKALQELQDIFIRGVILNWVEERSATTAAK